MAALNELTNAVDTTKKGLTAKVEETKTQLQENEIRISELEKAYAAIPTAGLGGSVFKAKSGASELANTLMQSPQFGAFAKRDTNSAQLTANNLSIKAVLTNEGLGGTGSNGYPTAPQRGEGLYGVNQLQLTLLDFLPFLPVTSSTFEYVQVDNYQNAANYQLQEGDLKAEQKFANELIQAQIATIAAWTEMSNQVIEDNAYLARALQDLLFYGVRQKLENELINGAGGTGQIKGLLAHAEDYTGSTTAKLVDKIGDAYADMENSGLYAGVVLMNRKTFQSIRSERAADGKYVISTPANGMPPMIWDVPVITSPSMAVGDTLVLDTRQVAVLDRQQPTVKIGNEAKMTQNITQMLAELRAGLAVFSKGAVLKITSTSTKSK